MEETPVLARPDSKTLYWAFPLFKNIHLNTKKITIFCLSKDMIGLRMFFLVSETVSTSMTSNNKNHCVTGFSLSSA